MPKPTESAAFQRMRNRVEDLERHLQLVDASLSALNRAARVAKPGTTVAGLAGAAPNKYPRLKEPLSEAERVINFSRARNVEAAIVAMFRYTTDYLHEAVGLLFKHDPMLVVGKATGKPALAFHEIVELGSWSALAERLVDDVFRSLENERSTAKLIEKVLQKTGVSPDEDELANALAFLEMRHLVIHRSGKIDAEFAGKFSARVAALTHLDPAQLVVGSRLPTRAVVAEAAITAILRLVESIDTGLVAGGLIPHR